MLVTKVSPIIAGTYTRIVHTAASQANLLLELSVQISTIQKHQWMTKSGCGWYIS